MFVHKDHLSENQMVDYILGNLPRDEYFKINTHLNKCTKCHLQVRSWQRILHHENEQEVPALAKQRIYHTYSRNRKFFRQRNFIFYISASIFVLFLTIYFIQQEVSLPANDTNKITIEVVKQHPNSQTIIDKKLENPLLSPKLTGENIYLKTNNKTLIRNEPTLFYPSKMYEQIYTKDDRFCFINWNTLNIICVNDLQLKQKQLHSPQPLYLIISKD